jgi:hypothetical protein
VRICLFSRYWEDDPSEESAFALAGNPAAKDAPPCDPTAMYALIQAAAHF